MLVLEAMTPDPVTVDRDTTVKKAIGLLVRHSITALPVVDGDGVLVGVVSETDLIRGAVPPDPRAHLAPHGPDPRAAHLVDAVLTEDPVTIRAHADVATAVDLMLSLHVKSLPVVDEHDRLLGIIARSDVVRLLGRPDRAIAAEIRETLRGAGYPEWQVGVTDGVVVVTGPRPSERSLAESVAHTVAGVVEVRVG